MKCFLLALVFCCSMMHATQSVYIIVHGTWCTPFNWHMPGGDFYEALKATAQLDDASIVFLNWSGKNSHDARLEGAQRLVNLINTYAPSSEINLIGHSHGGNVCILASQLLAKTPYYINKLYTLGTPIDSNYYAPNMQKINLLYNVFSFGDMVQTVGGLYKREYPDHERIWNIRFMLDGKAPNHIALHDYRIASWIATAQIMQQHNYLLEIKTGHGPVITIDIDREKLRQKNSALIALYNDPLRKLPIACFSPCDQEPH